MKLAIVGSGISGLVSAHLLHPNHDVTIFEAGDHVGGHTQTIRLEREDGIHDVDTGFVVFNKVTYPNFLRLIESLGVAYKPTEMSFSVRDESIGLEYCGSSLNRLFAQRRNLLRPSFHRMLRDIVRFNRDARVWLETGADARSLGELLAEGGFSRAFISRYIVPMGSAIWSASPKKLLEFPARFFLRFLDNHGLLTVNGQHPWYVIDGGSRRYVDRIIIPFEDRIRLHTPIRSVRRLRDRVVVTPVAGEPESFDQVILATHSDQALSLLEDPADAEREILGAIRYEQNDVVLHTDTRLLPRSPRARASWNYHLIDPQPDRTVTTYDMNSLQGLEAREIFCVTLNRTANVDPDKILRRFSMAHPVYTPATPDAQTRHDEISGRNRTHFCGAYWGNGFHEDGVNSALAVCAYFDSHLRATEGAA
jgi:predicted NAD/FAD-binding protein